MKLNKQIFGWLGASALLMTTACTSNESFDEPQNDVVTAGEVYGNGSKLMTLTLSAEGTMSTRDDVTLPYISDGSKADKLFLQVWEANSESALDKIDENSSEYVKVSSTTVKKYPFTVTLSVDPEKYYRVALWAQSSQTDVYDTSDLTKVKVSYPVVNNSDLDSSFGVAGGNGALNNDELRDAFCATKVFAGASENVNIIMHRPFAQINVGTTGADYNNYMEGTIYPNKTVKYSQVVIKGVYDCIDIANDEVKMSEENTQPLTVIFGFNQLPAFITSGIPTDEKDLLKSFTNEQHLRVKLNPDGKNEQVEQYDKIKPDADGFLPYRTKYPTIKKKTGTYLTETFRYMSMSYVLVKSEKATLDPENPTVQLPGSFTVNYYDVYDSSTLDEVSVYFSQEEGGADGYRYFTITQVPVHRNWRTNLLGGLWAPGDDDDPDNPDDPSSLFANSRLCVNLCPIYFGENYGEYNYKEETGVTEWFENLFPSDSDSLHENFGDHYEDAPSFPNNTVTPKEEKED